jgi:hypothetical protein
MYVTGADSASIVMRLLVIILTDILLPVFHISKDHKNVRYFTLPEMYVIYTTFRDFIPCHPLSLILLYLILFYLRRGTL